ncbi:DUF5994 family protein [Acrocarpospora catenulata]|uniref:DUF5994 family protein n=1 Tax=Acrocarpospora catenulata TaxID=2836182 RepID=UPI001BD93C91|nr:DUF5994 family protein [Acrocarpospora catenulata]
MTPTLLSHYTPLNPVASAIPRVDSPVRLSLNPVRDRRVTVDGAWWPYSRDAAAELPGLIAAVDQRLAGTTLRIGLRQDEWDHIPHRIPARGRQVRIGWFSHAEPHVLTMSLAGAEPIALLVIPPGTTTGPAEAGLKLAAEDTTGFAPAEILTIAHLFTAPDVGLAYEDDSPAWENEGGYVTAQP